MIAELENSYIRLREEELLGLQATLPLLEAVVQSGKPSTTGICGSFVRRTGHLDPTALEGAPQTPFPQFV